MYGGVRGRELITPPYSILSNDCVVDRKQVHLLSYAVFQMNKLILILIIIYNENKILHDKRREMMSNILLVYASTTGNTDVMAEAITYYLIVHRQDVVTKSFDFDRIDRKSVV